MSTPSFRAKARRHSRINRFQIERLEERLPLGDTLGLLLGSSLLFHEAPLASNTVVADDFFEIDRGARKQTVHARQLAGDSLPSVRASSSRLAIQTTPGSRTEGKSRHMQRAVETPGHIFANAVKPNQELLDDLFDEDFDGLVSSRHLSRSPRTNPTLEGPGPGKSDGPSRSSLLLRNGSRSPALVSPVTVEPGVSGSLRVAPVPTPLATRGRNNGLVVRAQTNGAVIAAVTGSRGNNCNLFLGTSPPVIGSSGALTIELSEKAFHWKSFDPILKTVDTGRVTDWTTWNFTPGTPDRLVFVGTGGGATVYGNVLFDPYNRAVVDVVMAAKRVRYLVTDFKVNETIHKPRVIDSKETAIPDDKKLTMGAQTFVNLDNDDKGEKFDINDENVDVKDTNGKQIGDNELSKLVLRLEGNPLNKGTVKLEAAKGGNTIKVWRAANKDCHIGIGRSGNARTFYGPFGERFF